MSVILAGFAICFGLRLAMVKSEAQAERRLERSRSATPAPSRRRKLFRIPFYAACQWDLPLRHSV